MNILVTGGAGYIGAHFINKLKDQDGARIIVVDNFSQGRNNVISAPNISYEEADILDNERLDAIFSGQPIDLVVHYAALASVPDSVSRPSDYYRNNVIGGLNILDAMLKHKVKKIINSSSAAVYGEPQCEVIAEDHPKNPTNPYGSTKLMFERILEDYHRAYGIDSVSFRYFCAAGADESGLIGEYHEPESHVIPMIANTALGHRTEFHVFGSDYPTLDGSGIRDYIHVNDLASAHLLALEKLLKADAPLCERYNLGINRGFSVLELIAAAEKVSENKVGYSIKPRRPGDPSRLIADASKASRELGWEPRYRTIEGIIASAYEFFKNKNQ